MLISRDLELIRWTVSQFGVTGDVASIDCGGGRLDDVLLGRFCAYGTVRDVKWVIETLDLNSISTDFGFAFADACDQRNLEVVLWMSDQCDNDDSYYEAISRMLYRACWAGDPEEAETILNRFGQELIQRDPSLNTACVARACASGNQAMVMKLVERLDVSQDAVLPILNDACCSGNLDLVKWIAERFDSLAVTHAPGRSAQGVESGSVDAVLRAVCSKGHTDIAVWLIERYQITAAGACEQQPLPATTVPVSAWEWALRLPDARLARWMSDRYGWGLHGFL